jgi:propionate catabolism operon transcriptional regulator
MPVIAEYSQRAVIEIVDGTFSGALAIGKDRIERGLVDVFVSAGSNASILRAGLQAPVAVIQLSGFDILQVLIKAREIDKRVGLVMYGQTIPELDAVKDLLNIEIAQYVYQTPEDARQRFEQLRKEGFKVIVGSSLVVELAEEAGLHGLLAYSLSSIRQGFEDAIELARVAQLEAGRYEQLNGVLHNLQDAVVAVDRDHRIIAINSPMEKLIKGEHASLLGQDLSHVDAELSLQSILQSGREERSVVQRYAHRDWVVNRTAIREHGMIVGAALTLYDARTIQDADTSLRIQQRRQQNSARYRFDGLIGQSQAFLHALNKARRFARTDLTVLITGESGVGKELFAQSIHNESLRAGRPFVAVNCAAFPETLLESELFGYEEGAFTGSRRGGKRGLFEAAHSGTLFLDEIGDMPLSLQTRLLRVLQEREITRLGAVAAIPVDVRIVAATHQPLAQLVAEGRFRQDLYYRIHTLCLALPTLRERLDDVGLLARAILKHRLQDAQSRLDADAVLPLLMPWLMAYDWPGNVRELENICIRLAVGLQPFANIEDIDMALLQEDIPELFSSAPSAPEIPLAEGSDKDKAEAALLASRGNRQQAARRLGVSRSTLWRWLNHAQGDPAHKG